MKKWIPLILCCTAAAVGLGVFGVHLYRQKQNQTSELNQWQQGQGDQTGKSTVFAEAGLDYALLEQDRYSEENARNRQQPFANDTVIFGGSRYTRNTAVKAILLIGEGAAEAEGKAQSGGLALLAFHKAKGTVTVIEIPRDTMAEVPGSSGPNAKTQVEYIGNAFANGNGKEKGCAYTVEAVSKLLGGLKMDHYLMGNLALTGNMNDLVGGVTVEVPDGTLEKLDPALQQGAVVTLNAEQAELFFNSKKRLYIQAFEKQLREQSKDNPEIVDQVFEATRKDMLTDMGKQEYSDLVRELLAGGALEDDNFVRIPGENMVQGEYHPRYKDLDKMILDIFYRKVEG